jgi:hypothetical protein
LFIEAVAAVRSVFRRRIAQVQIPMLSASRKSEAMLDHAAPRQE